MATLSIILALFPKRGLNQIRGKTKGPKHKKPINNVELLKYHFSRGLVTSIEPQYLHFIASSWISSAQ
jgi:hypothetical protein